jgi:hypothetical protein
MNLIEEIELADTQITSEFRTTDLWLSIKAALEAAQEMDRDLCAVGHQYTTRSNTTFSQDKFRAAMEGNP